MEGLMKWYSQERDKFYQTSEGGFVHHYHLGNQLTGEALEKELKFNETFNCKLFNPKSSNGPILYSIQLKFLRIIMFMLLLLQ